MLSEALSCLICEKASIELCDGRAHPCVSHCVAGNLLFIAELVTWERECDAEAGETAPPLLGGPLMVGPFQGAQTHRCFARKVWIAAARRRKCKTGTSGCHEHKPLSDLTSLLQFCQDKRAGSWLILWTCLASSMKWGSHPSVLCIFVPSVLIASRKDAALFKRRKLAWPSKKHHSML